MEDTGLHFNFTVCSPKVCCNDNKTMHHKNKALYDTDWGLIKLVEWLIRENRVSYICTLNYGGGRFISKKLEVGLLVHLSKKAFLKSGLSLTCS